MIAWKQVYLEDAHFIETGRLKIGRLIDYAELENGREDDGDGVVAVRVDTLMTGIPEHERAMTRLGFHAGVMVGCQIRYTSPPVYAFCLSRQGCTYDPSPFKPKATFAVSAHSLAWLLASKLGDRILGWKVDRVTYLRRNYNALEETYGTPDPFVKDLDFAQEQEVRIIFIPKPGTPFETIYTETDMDLARAFNRVL